ncbi:MAG: hypothetical protein ACLQF0_01395 [Dissulfurispiraceae bacterium]
MLKQKEDAEDHRLKGGLHDTTSQREHRQIVNAALDNRLRARENWRGRCSGACIIDVWACKHPDGSVTSYKESALVPLDILPEFILVRLDLNIQVIAYLQETDRPPSYGPLGRPLDLRQYIMMARAAKVTLEAEKKEQDANRAKRKDAGGFVLADDSGANGGVMDVSGGFRR